MLSKTIYERILSIFFALALFFGSCLPAAAAESPLNVSEVVPLGTYQSVSFFSNGLAVTQNEQYQYGVINSLGAVVIPFGEYSLISSFSDGVAVVYNSESLCGVIDTDGVLIVPFGKYYWIDSFSDGVAWVSNKDGKYGVINKTGELVIEYGKYELFSLGKIEGRMVHGSAFSEGYACILRYHENELQSSLIDKTGTVIIPFGMYSTIGTFNDGRSRVVKGDFISEDNEDSRVGVIDTTGTLIVPLGTYDEISHFSDGLAIVRSSEDCGVIDIHGALIVPFGAYRSINPFRAGSAVVRDEGGKYGRIDIAGQLIIPFGEYDRPPEGIATVQNDEAQYGVIDSEGNILIPFGRYDYISSFNDNAAYVLRGDDIWEWFDTGDGDVQYGVIALVSDMLFEQPSTNDEPPEIARQPSLDDETSEIARQPSLGDEPIDTIEHGMTTENPPENNSDLTVADDNSFPTVPVAIGVGVVVIIGICGFVLIRKR